VNVTSELPDRRCPISVQALPGRVIAQRLPKRHSHTLAHCSIGAVGVKRLQSGPLCFDRFSAVVSKRSIPIDDFPPLETTRGCLLQALRETGATGLEPATSGVTGHFQGRDMNDGGHAIALLMRFLGFAPRLTRMVERNKIGRLLPDCCPNLPQAVRCHERRSLDVTGAPCQEAKLMPMQPSLMAEISRLLFPSLRFCIAFPFRAR